MVAETFGLRAGDAIQLASVLALDLEETFFVAWDLSPSASGACRGRRLAASRHLSARGRHALPDGRGAPAVPGRADGDGRADRRPRRGAAGRADRRARDHCVEALGKNLLIRFDNGLEMRTHLRMNGSWHRYRPGERVAPAAGPRAARARGAGRRRRLLRCAGRRAARAARRGAPRAARAASGRTSSRRTSMPTRRCAACATRAASAAIAEALVDQRALAGIGNVYKSEILWIERVSPFAAVARSR